MNIRHGSADNLDAAGRRCDQSGARRPGLRALPSHVLDRNGPAMLRPRHAIPALPWLWRFIRAGRPAKVKRIAAALSPMQDGLRLGSGDELAGLTR